MEGIILQLASLDVWEATVLTCLEQRENRGKHRQKVYADSFTAPVREVVSQFIARVRRFIQIWVTEELEFPSEITGSDSKKDRRQNTIHRTRRYTLAFCVSSTNLSFISGGSQRFTDYVRILLGLI